MAIATYSVYNPRKKNLSVAAHISFIRIGTAPYSGFMSPSLLTAMHEEQ
jgi:hypothetical protein